MAGEQEYLSFDAIGITRVGCMKCNATVASRQPTYAADGRVVDYRLIHMSHSKRLRVVLKDLSYAEIIVCQDCLSNVLDSDLSGLEETMRWGWKKETEWQFGENYRPYKEQAYTQLKKHFDIKNNEVKFPLRVWKALFKDKEILRRA